MKSINTFIPEQISDAEQLLKELEKVPKNKRSFIVMVITAYINGIEAGSAYMQDSFKRREQKLESA